MSKAVDNYEQVSVYNLSDERREELLDQHAECTFTWTTRDGWPVGVIMSYLWKDGRFWLTAGGQRHRIEAVRRDPRVCITLTSTGTKMGPGKSITAKGRLHDPRGQRDQGLVLSRLLAASAQGSENGEMVRGASSIRRSA